MRNATQESLIKPGEKSKDITLDTGKIVQQITKGDGSHSALIVDGKRYEFDGLLSYAARAESTTYYYARE